MISKEKEIHLAQNMLNFVENKCEEQQVISGCTFDEEGCSLCTIYKARKTGQKLLDSLVAWNKRRARIKKYNKRR